MKEITVAECRLAIVSGEFSDHEVTQLFLGTTVTSEADIDLLVSTLYQHRPHLSAQLAARLTAR